LPPGGKQPWIVWKIINKLIVGVAETKANMVKPGYPQEGPGPCQC